MGDEVRDAILRLPNCPNSVCLATNYWSRRGPSLSVGSEEQTELLPVAHFGAISSLGPTRRRGGRPGRRGGARRGGAGVRESRRAPEPEKRRKERAEERQGHDADGRRNTT